VLQGWDKGRPAPAWVDEEPSIDEIGFWFLEAFWTLSTCRSLGMAYGPIPWTAIDYFSQRRGLDDTSALIFTQVIREMDSAFLAWQAGEAEARRKK
jgi:hypothetical protein